MRECEKCGNYIPDGMKICPHCGKLPPTLWPQFGVYAVLTIVAIVCAVYFRPFLNGPVIGEVSQGVLWVAASNLHCLRRNIPRRQRDNFARL